jgi:hypothetical protein
MYVCMYISTYRIDIYVSVHNMSVKIPQLSPIFCNCSTFSTFTKTNKRVRIHAYINVSMSHVFMSQFSRIISRNHLNYEAYVTKWTETRFNFYFN